CHPDVGSRFAYQRSAAPPAPVSRLGAFFVSPCFRCEDYPSSPGLSQGSPRRSARLSLSNAVSSSLVAAGICVAAPQMPDGRKLDNARPDAEHYQLLLDGKPIYSGEAAFPSIKGASFPALGTSTSSLGREAAERHVRSTIGLSTYRPPTRR